MKFCVENYGKDGNILNPKKVILNFDLIYTLVKKYLKEV